MGEVELKTNGPAGDTRMWLHDEYMAELEYDDNDGDGSFSYIHRVCGVNALPAGSYYVKVDEYGNNQTIPTYDISLNCVRPCVPGDRFSYLPFAIK